MKGFTLAAGAMLAAATAVQADTPPGVVHWSISKRNPHPLVNRRRDTADTEQADLQNIVASGGYFVECSVGTPNQTVTLLLDTGSSDTWMVASNATVCTSNSGGLGSRSSSSSACSYGSFDSSASSTFTVVDQDAFSITYVDGSGAAGDYFTDTFTMGDITVSNLTMGLGSDSDIAYGLVGIGYTANEAIVSSKDSLSAQYANLPAALVDSGLINSKAYSLWLNDLDSSSGSLLFGGIDTDKYEGDLTRINIYKTSSTYTSFQVALTAVNATSTSGTDQLSSKEFPIGAILDSGTTLSYLPNDLATEIWTEVGAVYSSSLDLAVIPCSKADVSGQIQFGFGGTDGPIISVGMDELVLDLGSNAVFTSGEYKGQSACEFGIQNSSSTYLLGDTFLRSAYVVYDMSNNEIGIAQTTFNATTSNIVAFTSSGATIPSSTAAPNQDEVTSSTSESLPGYSAASGFGDLDSGSSVRFAAMEVFHVCVISISMFMAGGLFVL